MMMPMRGAMGRYCSKASELAAYVRRDERARGPVRGKAIEAERLRIHRWCRAGDERGHHRADRGAQLEAMAGHAGRDEEARQRRLIEDGHPVRSDVEGAGVSARV